MTVEVRRRPFPEASWAHVLEGMCGGLLLQLVYIVQFGTSDFDLWKATARLAVGGIAGALLPDRNPVVVAYHGLTAPAVIALLVRH